MRPIKFRAWDKEEKRMLSWDELFQTDNFWYGCSGKDEWVDLMQFTGLHDKNGKEIFEGDIYKNENLVGEVFYDKRFACFGMQMNGGVHALVFGDSDHEPCIDDDTLRGKVLGNIYENPELLKPSGGD